MTQPDQKSRTSISRRGLAGAFLAVAGGIAAASQRLRAATTSVLPRPNGDIEKVATGTTRADATWLQPKKMVRALRYSDGGPYVDMLFEIVEDEPADDVTRIVMPDGRWGRQVFPSGILNAHAFGAVGDGKTDDTIALQNYIDIAVTRGMRAYIPPGTYRITRPLEIGQAGSRQRYRGFVIEGSARTGIDRTNPAGGTLILLDSPAKERAVVLWQGSAWRDGRLSSMGLASQQVDGASYGLLVTSSEVSHLQFDDLGVDNVETAFGLLAGTGINGEYCTWTRIQTRNVLNFFYSDAGQAYGLRFRDSFCYYREGGTLFRFEAKAAGGGLHLDNFDATPVLPARIQGSTSGTRLFVISGSHKAPITVIGGRFEHITTIADITSGAQNIVVHNHLQFIGSDFTTDLTAQAAAKQDAATVRLRLTALADVNFLNCAFSSAWPQSDAQIVQTQADRGCRGNVRFNQCGFAGYAAKPTYAGPQGDALQVDWQDCTANDTDGSRGLTYGRRYDRRANQP